MQKRIAKEKRKRLALTTALVAVVALASSTGAAGPPYPPSSVIKSITWHWDTHTTAAPGSDLWPVTWASDGNIYTAWGDGGGFGGTNSDGRVTMGFARIEGAPESYVGINVNGGKDSESPASFPKKGKSGGILSVRGTLYARLNLQDGEWPSVNFALAWSENLGDTWTKASWVFPKGQGNFKPSRFLNFGKDYAGVPIHLAGFVYFYGFKQDIDSGSGKSTYMGRVPQGKMKDRSAYEFFKDLDADGKPIWTSDVKEIQPVFADPTGVCLGGVVYNPGIKRYILTSYHTGPGQLGIFDASEPWGPWTTVAYYDSWGNMGIAGSGLNCDFPQKWMGTDGLTMWCVFSVYGDGAKKGVNAHDKFNLVKATLMLLSNEDCGQTNKDNDRIKIYKENPRYWQYKGKPVLLARRGGAGDVTFTRTRLTTVAETNMGHVPVADINGDGVIDLVAGLQWFEGPSWRRHPLYPPDPKPTAIDIGFTVPYDLDGDGDLDLMTHRRSGDDRNKNELFWFENPGPPSMDVWTKHHITWDTRWPEVIIFVDIDGDGRDEMICSDVCPDKGIRIYEIPQDPENASSWSWTTVEKSPLHGLGIGDLNEDGRLDIVSDFVWFEQDARGGWFRHSLPSPGSARRGHETMQIKIYDVDADGDVDLILPRAHHYGAFWLESSGGKKPSFKLHEILPGKLPSQLHGVAYGDIDGDGDLDIFAGKSRYRHGDPGNDEPLDVFWIELVRSSGPIRWVKHQLATDLTMGIGPTIADVDADGDMDLVLRGHGIGGRYVIGTRQTDVTLFIQNASVPAPAKLTAKSTRSVTLRPPGSGPWVDLLADGGTRPDPYKDPECK